MRTKHFLFTLAIGALAAACSQDEFEAQNEQNTDAKLSIRPEIGNVFTLEEDPLTRLTTGDGESARPVFAENDKLGAAIIDVPTYTSPYAASVNPITKYHIIEGYGCNNAFTTSDGGKNWESDQPMVEGNYLFYAPYQPGLAFRSPLKVMLPAKQDGSEVKKALKDFYEGGSVVRVGYRFLKSGDETKTPNVTMYDVFSYPKFTLKNNFDGYLFDSDTKDGNVVASQEITKRFKGEITVDSIQFCSKDAEVVVGGYLKHSTASTTGTAIVGDNENDGNAAASVIEALHRKNDGFTSEGEWNIVSKKLTTKTSSLIDAASATKNSIGFSGTANVITTVKFGSEGKKVANGGTLSFHAVFPAKQFTFGSYDLTAKVYITVEGKHYIIATADFAAPVEDQKDKLATTTNKKDGVVFTANGNAGLKTLTFANGQKLPSEAIYIDEATGKLKPKANVKNLLEINLVGGVPTATDLKKQIAVQKEKEADAPVTIVKTTADLITLINNAATGTNWEEGDKQDTKDKKYFQVASENTLEINSALIDAMYNGNQLGTLQLTTVAPINNNVKVAGVTGTKVTFESENGKKMDITLNGAVTADEAATNKYVILPATFTASNLGEESVVIANSATTLNLSDALKIKSLHVIAATGNLTVTGAKTLTAENIRVDGQMSVADDVVAKILNEGKMTISKNVVGELVNNGEIGVGTTSAFTVNGGEGDVVMNYNETTKNIVVGASATQRVIYKAENIVGTTQIKAAAAVTGVNTLKANGLVTLETADIDELKAIKTIILKESAGIKTAGAGTYNLSGITIDATAGAMDWAGTVSTTVNNASIILNAGKVTLKTVNVNGTATYKGTGRISADGTTAKWNGGKGDYEKALGL